MHPAAAVLLPLAFLCVVAPSAGATEDEPMLMEIADDAWAANSVNTVVFRNDPITTHGNRQFAAYYNAEGRVVVAARDLDAEDWETRVTAFSGNVRDAHNAISLGVDGAGFLHLSWDHHAQPLRYARGSTPGSLDFTDKIPMTGLAEAHVTYPQFYAMADGRLLFLYRDGGSGNGNLVLNRYDPATERWTQLHKNLISGEGKRNAYWQAAVDAEGTFHLSWVWRESGDVATNHDMLYARSTDGGETWTRTDGSAYELPVTAATAETAAEIPQRHELINSTSMCADGEGHPIIATYFRPEGATVPQYFVIRHDGDGWQTMQATQRTTPFSLSGGGTKQIPIARPQVIARTDGGKTAVWVIFRDVDEREGRVSVASCPDLSNPTWTTSDLTDFSVGYWEPGYDRVRWARDGVLNLYVQKSGQGDTETLQDVPPQPARVLEWKPSG